MPPQKPFPPDAGPPTPEPQPRRWDPGGQDKAPASDQLDPRDFARMTPEQKVDTLVGMIALVKQFGGDPKAMLKEVLATLPEEQRAAMAADPQMRAQLQTLLNLM